MLKVGSPQPPIVQEPLSNTNNISPMDEPQNNGDFMNDMPPMDNPNNIENQFDNDFDAGVDADEETDPRRYIEQLTGKLSQKLNDYNQNQSQPDSELSKYVIGMIAAQATKGLSPEDKEEVLDKIENGETFEEPQQQDDLNEPDNTDNTEDVIQMESLNRTSKIDEVFQDLTNPEKITNNIEMKRKDNKQSFKIKPYISPNFK